MINIVGKTLVFTDIHFGIRNNHQSRQKICIQVIKKIIQMIESKNIQNCIFMGDYFHVRSQLSVDTINIAYKCMQALAKKCQVFMIIGNHDIFLKNSVEISSVKIFSDIQNVHIIEKPTEAIVNGNMSLLLPWLSDTSIFKEETYDMLFGHFDISSDYLIKSYIEQNSQTSKTNDKVGNFVNLAKIEGTVFAGHIHTRKEFRSKDRNFIFVGSPYQQNLGEIGNICGVYIIDTDNNISFEEIKDIPKHVEVKISDIMKVGVENFDFQIVSGNIIHKIYDVDIDKAVDASISQKILDMDPYEELLPDYDIQVKSESLDQEHMQSIELLRKNKLEYVRNYIENIQDKALQKDNIEKDKLFKILENYYNKASI